MNGGVRAFSTSINLSKTYTAGQGTHFSDIHFPNNLESTPSPDARAFTIQETQDYLASKPKTFTGPWKVILFPPITDRDFTVQLTNSIQSLPSGKAYAVLFSAEGQGRYATLGPSFIVTSNSDPEAIIEHLQANHHFACENSRGTFNDQIICKYRYLGQTSRVVPDVFRSKIPTKRTTSSKGIVRQTLALPIPHFDLKSIHESSLSARHDSNNLTRYLAKQLRSLSRKNDVNAYRRLEYSYNNAWNSIETAGSGPITSHPDWKVDSFTKRSITLSGPNQSIIRAYLDPSGHYSCIYTDGNISLN